MSDSVRYAVNVIISLTYWWLNGALQSFFWFLFNNFQIAIQKKKKKKTCEVSVFIINN